VTAVLHHIQALENYVERNGARLVRCRLPEWVHGRVRQDLITLHADLSPEQELPALVHELAHWLAHRNTGSRMHCTLFEYEAEAVEQLVMARLGLPLPCHLLDPARDSPTDDLLSASVARVRWASELICAALGLQPQAAVDVDAPAREEIVLEYEEHRLRDFLGAA
jgi:hypothetical protein